MKGLEKLTTTKLSAWVQQAKIEAERGEVTDRIPQLAKAYPGWFAVHICCKSGKTISFGDTACVFSLM
ncbi:MAG: glutaminase, partial [Nostoc sp.]